MNEEELLRTLVKYNHIVVTLCIGVEFSSYENVAFV